MERIQEKKFLIANFFFNINQLTAYSIFDTIFRARR